MQLSYLNHPCLLLINYSKLAISQNISIVDYSFKLDHDCMEIFILYMFHNLSKGIREVPFKVQHTQGWCASADTLIDICSQ